MSKSWDRTVAALDLSVCIVSYNTRQLLDACLASLYAGSLAPEVIVADNGSTDGSVALVRSRYAQAQVIALSANVGFARASNQAMTASTGRYILLLNSDTVVLDDALAQMVAYLDAHPELSALGPLLLNADGSVQTSCFAFTTVRDVLFEMLGLSSLFPRSPLFNRRGLGGFDRRTEREVDWVSGACLMVRRLALPTVGLLDDGFFMYGEELDWCYRMKEAGLRVAFYPAARVVHYGRGSSTRSRGALAPRALAGRLRYFRKHHGAAAVWQVRLIMIVGMALRLLALPVRAVLRPTGDWRADLAWYAGLLRAAIRPGDTFAI